MSTEIKNGQKCSLHSNVFHSKKRYRSSRGHERVAMGVVMDLESNKRACVCPCLPLSTAKDTWVFSWETAAQTTLPLTRKICPWAAPHHMCPHMWPQSECPPLPWTQTSADCPSVAQQLQWHLHGRESFTPKLETLTMMTRRIFWKSFLWPRV